MENIPSNNDSSSSLSTTIAPYIKRWPIILLSILFFGLLGYIYLRYSTSIYESQASILLNDTGDGGISELSALGDLGALGNNFNSLENEMEILRSRRLMKQVVTNLNLEVGYFGEGAIKTTELYGNTPFKIQVTYPDNQQEITPFQIFVKIDEQSTITYSFEENVPFKKIEFGENVSKNGVDLSFITNLNNGDNARSGGNFVVRVYDLETVTSKYSSKLVLQPAVQQGSVIDLSITDPIPNKASDILDQLVKVFNEDAILDKNFVAQNTLSFIDTRLQNVVGNLDSVELKKERFKTENNITDISTEAVINLESRNEFRNKETELRTQIAISSDLLSFVQTAGPQELLPVNLAFDNLSVNSSIGQYNEIVTRLRKAMQTATAANPIVEELETSRRNYRASVISSLQSYIQSLRRQISIVSSNENSVSSRISQVPGAERVTRDIERNQKIIESIYVYLLEKREEAAISLAVKSPKAKIIDSALAIRTPIFPNVYQVILGAVIAGLIVPLLLIYVSSLFYNKIENRNEITKKLKTLPFLGEIPKLDSNDAQVIVKNDRSILAESFRILRTNLQYKIDSFAFNTGAPVIIVTSSIKGEGKTFVAFNLAMTMANSGIKVLLIGGDIRNGQLQRYATGLSSTTPGVTEYLRNPSSTASEFLHISEENPNLHIMPAGTIPPNPAEIWMSKKVEDLFSFGKQNYDFVIVDSAPAMLVTDTLLISNNADLTLYITRANYTEKPLLDFIKDTVANNKLKNVSIVLNSVKMANFGYGNKYAYSYGVDKDTTWTKLLKSIGLKK